MLCRMLIRLQDSDQKLVHPKAVFAGGIHPAGIPICFVAFASSAMPILTTRSLLTSVVLSALQQSKVKASNGEGAVAFAPLNLIGRCY
jgi:hypothetical protein